MQKSAREFGEYDLFQVQLQVEVVVSPQQFSRRHQVVDQVHLQIQRLQQFRLFTLRLNRRLT